MFDVQGGERSLQKEVSSDGELIKAVFALALPSVHY